jgi:hypothetical protein
MAGQSAIVRAPWQGVDLVSAPSVMRSDKGTSVVNFLPGRPGKLVLRGPIYQGVAATPHGTTPGFWGFDRWALFSRADGNLQRVENLAGINLSASFAPPVAGMLLSRRHTLTPDGFRAVGVAIDASFQPTKLYKWDGGAAAVNVVPINNGPTGADIQDVTTWLSRVIVLGGVPPGGGSSSIRALYWTDPSWDGTDTLVKWQDDVSGLTNQLVLDEAAHTLAVYNGALYVLGNTGIQVVRGSAPSNWNVRKVSNLGCVVGRAGTNANSGGFSTTTAVVAEEGIYYVSTNGVALFDGVQSTVISEPVRSLFSSLESLAELSILDDEWLHVLPSAGNRWFAYHRVYKTWSEHQSGLFTAATPKWLGSRPIPWAADTTRFLSVATIGKPDISAAVLTALSITNGQDAGGATSDIIATMKSKMVELAMPNTKSQLRRVCADIVLQSPAVSSQPAWTVSAIDEAGTVLATKSGISTTTPAPQHVVFDAFGEVDSIQLKWDIDGNAQNVTLCEIHDARVDHTPGQDRTG